MKVAIFGSGEMLLLGWDEANLLPVLVELKEDGTIRRFRDFDQPSRDPHPAPRPAVRVEDLQGAAFRPFGGLIVLAYPGTTKPIHILRPGGSDGMVSLQMPAGYVLNDVLASSESFPTIVARLRPEPSDDQPAKGEKPPEVPMRIFEFSVYNGARLREFLFDKVPASAVTCAANSSLIAIYPQPAESAEMPTGLDGQKSSPSTQLVVSTVRR